MQEPHCRATGGYLLHETVFIKIPMRKHKIPNKEMFYSEESLGQAARGERFGTGTAALGLFFRLRCYTVLAGSDEIIIPACSG